MASIFSILSPNLLPHHEATKTLARMSKSPLHVPQIASFQTSNRIPVSFSFPSLGKTLKTCALAQETSATALPVVERRLYVGNIPRTVDDSEITRIFEEHGAVEKAEVMYDKYSGRSRRFAFVTMKTVEDANAAIEKLNGSEIGGRQIKVNVTEKPLSPVDVSILQAEDSNFIDSPHKVYVGNLAKTVTSDSLTKFFSETGKVLSAKVSRVPGTSKSSGFGFVSFSSEEDVEAAISSLNNTLLEGQPIRVNKA